MARDDQNQVVIMPDKGKIKTGCVDYAARVLDTGQSIITADGNIPMDSFILLQGNSIKLKADQLLIPTTMCQYIYVKPVTTNRKSWHTLRISSDEIHMFFFSPPTNAPMGYYSQP